MKTNKGFSLIEVLVALLLTTIGVLGMVALQGRSIQYTQDSVQRNTAILLSGDLIEIIRAHPKELFNTSPPQFPMNSGLKAARCSTRRPEAISLIVKAASLARPE